MGLLKIDHIKAILSMPEVNEKFRALYKRDWNKGDVDEMYASFEKHLFASLKDFTTPIPGVLETMAMLREQGIKIGSTTGYTAKMMEIVRPGAEARGYRVDNLVTPNEVPAGRPAPYMIYKNMIDLAIPSVDQVVKVGDTIADIKEGVNAKVWSVGIVTGSNEMGVSEEKVREITKIAQEPVSLETPIGEEEDSHLGDFIPDDDIPAPAEAAAFTMLKEQLTDVLDTLTPREEKVLRLRFGLDDGRARTLEEVGKEFNVTRERIRQIEAKALRKLRHPSRSKKLKDFLE